MKKLTIIITTLVLVLGLAQCKKNVEEKNLVKMTLTASTNSDKTSIGTTGNIKWQEGDILNVVVNGSVRGTLSATTAANLSTFTGDVDMTGLDSGQDYVFFFYYIGGHELTTGTSTTTMSISEQVGTASGFRNFYIASGSATATYNTAGIEVATTDLTPYTAVVKVNRSGFDRYNEENEYFYMYGEDVPESVEINFGEENPFTPMNIGRYIHIGNSSSRENPLYYVLLPSGSDATTLHFVNKRTSAEIPFNNGIQSSRFYCKVNEDHAGIPVTGAEYAKGSLRGLFTVADGTVKHFSQGNLQATYDGNWSWDFAPHQYDAITNHTANIDIVGIMSVSVNGTVDLFGWNSTDGSSTNGINNSIDNADYGTNTELADWGGLIGNGWFTPNRYDWAKIFNERTVNEHRYTMVTIIRDLDNSVVRRGVILFPDNYSESWVSLSATLPYDQNVVYDDNNVTVFQSSEWPMLEAAGCVFLPATCYREGTDVKQSTYAQYWTSTYGMSNHPDKPLLWQFGYNDSNGAFNNLTVANRYRGCAVRLLCD